MIQIDSIAFLVVAIAAIVIVIVVVWVVWGILNVQVLEKILYKGMKYIYNKKRILLNVKGKKIK